MAQPSEIMEVDEKMISEIRRSVQDTGDRGLRAASKWSTELLMSIPSSQKHKNTVDDALWHTSPTPIGIASPFDDHDEKLDLNKSLELQETDEIESAKRCMDSQDYLRASYYAKGCRSPKGVFIYVYSRFLISEQTAIAEWHKTDGTRFQPPRPVNLAIGELLEIVESARDPFLQFLKALFNQRLTRDEETINLLVESISGYPWNWSAWILLESCVESREELLKILSRLTLPENHPLRHMMIVKTVNGLCNATPAELATCDSLLGPNYFPDSCWLMAQRARSLYINSSYHKAIAEFENILKIDPYRLEDIDVYANMLYAMQQRNTLSALVDKLSQHSNEDRPEVCCVYGYMCSTRLEHEKAVKYFKRATRLDPTCHHAWAHLGFEYLEIANPPAGIEAFRRALDISKKDYRPWYGMAQAYMHLNLPLYSIYYYAKARALRPFEPPILEGLASSYEYLSRYAEAILCYKQLLIRAGNTLSAVPIFLKIIKAFKAMDEPAEVAKAQAMVITIYKEGGYKPGQTLPEVFMRCLVECAEYHARTSDGNLVVANEYLKICLAAPGPSQEAIATMNLVRIKARQMGVSLT